MERPEDADLVRGSAARHYEAGHAIWDPADRWNVRKRAAIDTFARARAAQLLAGAESVLDAGCGSEPYAWLPAHTISFDRFWKQTRGRTRPVAGDLRSLPFQAGCMEFVVCVASVLNYVSAAEAIAEVARVTKPGGHLLLHFETSTSFEQLLNRRWGDPVVRITTINAGKEDTLWIYRPTYIAALLRASGFEIRTQERFHILSALGLRLGLGQQAAAPLAVTDRFMGALGGFADDVILLAERR